MDAVLSSMANTSLGIPLLDYTELGKIPDTYNSFWTWMALASAAVLTSWGLRVIRGFCIGVVWWENHAHVRVMLQSSSSYFSASTHNRLRKTDGLIAGDDLNTCRNMYMGDLEHLTGRKVDVNEKGRLKKSKTFYASDSLISCNTSESDSLALCDAIFPETEMLLVFGQSLPSLSQWTFPNRLQQQLEFHKECFIDKFCCSISTLNQVSPIEKVRSSRIVDAISINDINNLRPIYSSELAEIRDKWKGNRFAYDIEEKKGESLWVLDHSIGSSKWRELTSVRNEYGWDKLLSIRPGFEEKHCKVKFGLDIHGCPKYFVQDHTSNVWQVGWERGLLKLLSLTECELSSEAMFLPPDNVVRLWDIQVGRCLNEMTIKDSIVMGNHVQDSYGSLFSGIVRREQNSSLVVWDSGILSNLQVLSCGTRQASTASN